MRTKLHCYAQIINKQKTTQKKPKTDKDNTF